MNDSELVEYFCDRLEWPNFTVTHIFNWCYQNTATILRRRGLLTDPMLDQILQLAVEDTNIHKIRLYYSLGAKPDVEQIRNTVAFLKRAISYEFVTTILDLGVYIDFSQYFNTSEKQTFRKKYIPKLTINIPQGLVWLAATCYRQHYDHLPEADSVPTEVMDILHLAKYQYE